MSQRKNRSLLGPRFRLLALLTVWLAVLFLSGCSVSGDGPGPTTPVPAATGSGTKVEKKSSSQVSQLYGQLPTPEMPGIKTLGNDYVTIDISNATSGYYYVLYLGSNPKVKLQVTGPDNIKYTYNLTSEPACIPITGGNGAYALALYENISGDQYASVYKGSFEIKLENEFLPYIVSNQYVHYTDTSKAVILAASLVESATCDLEKVSAIYHYVIENITYDYEEAATVSSGYLPDIDEVLETKKGICFDYAALMAGMLRSCSIPTKLQIGYAGSAYHAWISVYLQDVGWIDGMIRFDGKAWSLMDPTFAANSDNTSLKKFIGDGNNYKVLYSY